MSIIKRIEKLENRTKPLSILVVHQQDDGTYIDNEENTYTNDELNLRENENEHELIMMVEYVD